MTKQRCRSLDRKADPSLSDVDEEHRAGELIDAERHSRLQKQGKVHAESQLQVPNPKVTFCLEALMDDNPLKAVRARVNCQGRSD